MPVPAHAIPERPSYLTKEARPLAASPERADLLSASIRAAHEYGASEKQIAEVSGLSVADVRRIVE